MWSERAGGSSGAARRLGRCALGLGLSVLLVGAPAAAQDDADPAEPKTASYRVNQVGELAFDFGVLRTLGTVHLVVGSAFFVVAGPLSAPGGGWSTAWDVFVLAPYEETFERAPGRF